MAKIHTHYDNLKVARKAPQEVIRAAYKALSQKYHPDKNPGDEKAARIMAILNSAYGTLSDPLRRREHDDWIAAEEWEIAWLESTHAEDRQELLKHDIHPPQQDETPATPAAAARHWWLALALGVVLGGVVTAVLMQQDALLPSALARALGAKPPPPPRSPVAAPARAPEPLPEAPVDSPDSWAVGQAQQPDGGLAPEVRALAVTQLVIPARAPDCERELHTLVAPNGERWPAQSGYIDGFPLENRGSAMQILVDNSANASPVLVKVIDMARRSNVRHLYLLAHETFTVDDLSVGKYEVRYQNISVGGTREDCLVRRKAAASDAMAGAAP
ncbi:MAG TPA: J domain-containing protein [Telluria sp.]|jgi:hypothetical protein